MRAFIQRLAKEPPFRIVAKAILKKLKVSIKTRALWELSKRPQYLIGLVEASNQAMQQGHKEISVIEFGVAGGNGLVMLQEEAEAVENETGVKKLWYMVLIWVLEVCLRLLVIIEIIQTRGIREIIKWMKKNLNLV